MAIVGAAQRSRNYRVEAGKRSLTAGPRWPVPKFLTVCVILCALSFAGCARQPAPRELSPAVHETKAPPPRATPRPRRLPETKRYVQPAIRYVQPNIRRPDPALLSPQPAPDCEFQRSDLKTVDPDEWRRLKVEYERQCFQDAEKAARARLALLQTSNLCEIEPARPSRPAPSHPR